jgi:regulator of cell morphogenesis and NO signaling
MESTTLIETTNTTGIAVSKAADSLFVLDVTVIEPKLKHTTVFKYFDALQPGEEFEISNDHDPKPLYYQMIAERGTIFTWDYIEKGPERWRVQIKKNAIGKGETVGEMAAKDLRKAEVFKKFGIDFCCGGKKSLEQACNEKGLAIADVDAALHMSVQTSTPIKGYNNWAPGFLADFIYQEHHQYYYSEEPVITDLLNKVYEKHATTNLELNELKSLYSNLRNELDAHFKKEEIVVFPFIKTLEKCKAEKSEVPVQPSLADPIQLMESEHEVAGDILREIRRVTNNYTAQEGACNSFQLLYKKLHDLEEDLHQHIHLENNILFPKAIALEKEVSKLNK